MRIVRMGHAALLIETAGERILVDPGAFSDTWNDVTDLDAILVTHQHADHVHPPGVARLVRRNPQARVIVEESVVPLLGEEGIAAESTHPGTELRFGSVRVEVVGGDHAVIHERIPRVGNVGYVFTVDDGPRLYHPGDSYEYPLEGIDVLALPLTAPWARVAMTADYLAAVRPAQAFPIHDAIVSQTGWTLYLRLVRELGGSGVEVHSLGNNDALEL